MTTRLASETPTTPSWSALASYFRASTDRSRSVSAEASREDSLAVVSLSRWKRVCVCVCVYVCSNYSAVVNLKRTYFMGIMAVIDLSKTLQLKGAE